MDRPGERRTRRAVLHGYGRFPLDVLVTFALNNRSRDARDLVSVVASGRRGLSYDELITSVRDAGAPKYLPAAISALATLVADQPLSPDDVEDVLALYDYLDRHVTMTDSERLAWANALITSGQIEVAAHQLSLVGERTMEFDNTLADLTNPFRADPEAAGSSDWLSTFNSVFTRYGGEPTTLAGAVAGDTPFDRLTGATLPAVDGPLISVVMTAYRPGSEIFAAVRSILDQTWRNLELLVIDDGSPTTHDVVFDRLAALDDRVRVIRNSDNRGTYARRNQAIHAAGGRFVTRHDSDDWAHPRRLELQAGWLLEHSDAPAGISLCVRATPLLQFHQSRRTGRGSASPR